MRKRHDHVPSRKKRRANEPLAFGFLYSIPREFFNLVNRYLQRALRKAEAILAAETFAGKLNAIGLFKKVWAKGTTVFMLTFEGDTAYAEFAETTV